MIQPELVLFDLDNTITDRMCSLSVYTKEFERDFSDRLVPVDENYLFQIIKKADAGGYKPKRDMAMTLINELKWTVSPDTDEICDHWYMHFPRSVRGRDGLFEMLKYLEIHGIPRGIITNGRTRSQNMKVDSLGVREMMECIIISDDIGIKKPDPRIFEYAMSNFHGIAAGKTWYIGDDPKRDIKGGDNAGLVTVWFNAGVSWPTQYPRPRYEVETMWGLVKMIDQALDCNCTLSTTYRSEITAAL